MVTKKYAVYPGFIYSKYDSQLHFISASALMRLYRVKPDECIVINELRSPRSRAEQLELDGLISMAKDLNLIGLRPDYSGDYRIPG